MKSIYTLLKNIKNLLPYFALIAVYFFFINIEAKNDKNFKKNLDKEYNYNDKKSKLGEDLIRVKIPVVPFKE